MGLTKAECLALIRYHMSVIEAVIVSGRGEPSGAELQEMFDRVDTYVQAVKVLDLTQPGTEV